MANSRYIPGGINLPKGSYFLLGPRGTGKSTWLLHHYPEAVRIDLLLGGEEIWRLTKLEVDFVIYGPKGFWAIEVKRSSNLGPDDVRSLLAFKEEYPEAQCLFVIPGKRKEIYRGFPVIPMEEFLLKIDPENPVF